MKLTWTTIGLSMAIVFSCGKSASDEGDWYSDADYGNADDSGLSYGGDGESQGVPDNGGHASIDTGIPDDTGVSNTPEPTGDPPEISNAIGTWYDTNILVEISVVDPDDDIGGGYVGIDIDDLGEQWFTIQDTETATGAVEAAYTQAEDRVEITIGDFSPEGPPPTIVVRIKDAQTNASNAVTVDLAAPE